VVLIIVAIYLMTASGWLPSSRGAEPPA